MVGSSALAAAALLSVNEAGAQETAAVDGSAEAGIPARGYAAEKVGAALKPFSFTRRNLRSDDVLIDIQYAGICHTDLHWVNGDFGPSLPFTMVPGHEITGRVSAVGASVSKFKVGDIAGVGCLVDSCGTCRNCKRGLEQYCLNGYTLTYGSVDRHGFNTQGGYSNKIVVKEAFAFKIPDSVNLAAVTPLLCAGITTFSPMQRWNVGTDQKVAVLGLGGLGHVALKLFKARGADVTVFTTSEGKLPDALRMGATEAILWSDTAAFERLKGQFDFILATVPYPFDFNPFVDLLGLDGVFTNVGLVVPASMPNLPNLIEGRKSITGSAIGGVPETQEVLDYCLKRNITADIELIPIDHVNDAYRRVRDKDIRYRFVIDMTTLPN
ncbi:NAD(P)-dependent alcohol dehydrogenase [Ochrobactrum sp. S46]|nr:NAD(P)-dependent alcohol dehydrogenase [Ochrobactrum sp. S45]MBK0046202.1 NAD(P)-dependent alcohol dehydrogenase [Ochrobactrum sp. S46]